MDFKELMKIQAENLKEIKKSLYRTIEEKEKKTKDAIIADIADKDDKAEVNPDKIGAEGQSVMNKAKVDDGKTPNEKAMDRSKRHNRWDLSQDPSYNHKFGKEKGAIPSDKDHKVVGDRKLMPNSGVKGVHKTPASPTKEFAQKHKSSVKSIHEQVISDQKAMKKPNLPKSEKNISIPKKEIVKEHKELVRVLESKSHKDDKKEAKEQGKELKQYMKKGLDSLKEFLVKSNK